MCDKLVFQRFLWFIISVTKSGTIPPNVAVLGAVAANVSPLLLLQ